MPTPDPVRLMSGPLTLTFEWQGDRFGHRITLQPQAPSSAGPTPLLASLEGTPDDLWPASPPLQECHVESRPDGRQVALLVGRAGRSHWSLSVLCDPAAGSFFFEAACRLSGDPAWLGSRYQSFPAASAALEVTRSSADEQGEQVGSDLMIAAPVSTATNTRTVQWSYLMRPTS